MGRPGIHSRPAHRSIWSYFFEQITLGGACWPRADDSARLRAGVGRGRVRGVREQRCVHGAIDDVTGRDGLVDDGMRKKVAVIHR